MERIAIIGNAGGGKSELARKLGVSLKLPVHTFDDLQWTPNWVRAPENMIVATHTGWLTQLRWIIDGWGSFSIMETRFEAADTIIFVDFPIYIHYWWAIKRQIKAAFNRTTDWPPDGCAALPVTGRLFSLMWKIHHEVRPQLVEFINRYAANTQIVHLESPSEMGSFLKQTTHQK
jgi:hypothetical protein